MEIDFFDDEMGEYVGSLNISEEMINKIAILAEEEGYSTDDFIVQILKDKIYDRFSSLESGDDE